MPHSVPVSDLMVHRNEWPQLRAGTAVKDAVKTLRILTYEKKITHGHSTPLVLDDTYTLLGMIRLIDLLKSIRHLCDTGDEPCELGKAETPVSQLVVPFPTSVEPEDSILKALDIMMDNGISLIPVMKNGKLLGMLQLADVFNKVAAILFDEEIPDDRGWIAHYVHL
jgi:signal-transduction protein with cAMP-binding, CBS, and nucleotidyltransferase domain